MNNPDVANAIATIMLPDRVDSATSASVEALMIGALRPGAGLIVDGSAVVYMSAAGVRALAIVLHRAAELSAKIVFCSFSGPAADCLLVSGFSQLFDVADSTEQALSRLRPKLTGSPADRLHRHGATG